MLTPEQVSEIASAAEAAGIGESTVQALRQRYASIHITYCMDDDLFNHTPVIESADFNVYLVDGREHCLCLTTDYAAATGLVLAERSDEAE